MGTPKSKREPRIGAPAVLVLGPLVKAPRAFIVVLDVMGRPNQITNPTNGGGEAQY